mmetsp:Transcript_11311/g.24340  ORF Transcript_11311/g.24340 Transcript_11311/m.24340 type:complete len:84 (-) Transcript_11311:3270-3521(-)
MARRLSRAKRSEIRQVDFDDQFNESIHSEGFIHYNRVIQFLTDPTRRLCPNFRNFRNFILLSRSLALRIGKESLISNVQSVSR